MGRLNFNGTGVALVTPFNEDKSIDFDSLKKLIEFNISNGVNYLVALGTTAEAATLNLEEKNQVVEFIKKVNNKRLPLVVGIGGNDTKGVIDSFKDYNLENVDAILSVTPFYNKPTQDGLYEHFKQIALHSPLPVIMYNVPGRTGVNMNAKTTLRLANDFEKLAGIKEASADMEQATEILKGRPEGFKVFSGDDATTIAMIALGGDGVISVIGQGMPKEFTDLVNFCLNGDFKSAQKLQYRLIELIQLIFAEGNPGGIKALLNSRGILKEEMRLPLVNISAELKQKIKNQL